MPSPEHPPIRIGRRFRGPPESGNGGYVCGRLARLLEGRGAAVRLHAPPPLDREMEVRNADAGLVLLDGETVVAEARPASVDVDLPQAPSFRKAEAASRRFAGFDFHWYPTCFVCGPEREDDGLRIFAGRLEGSDLVAAPWVPDAAVGTGEGSVAPEFVWAALDCPGAFSFSERTERAIVLGELRAEIRGEVEVGERYVVVGWEIQRDGRKHFTGTALFGEAGDCRAAGVGIWFELPGPPS